MKKVFEIYVEDDEELVGIEGCFDVMKADDIKSESVYACFNKSEINNYDGFCILPSEKRILMMKKIALVKNGEC